MKKKVFILILLVLLVGCTSGKSNANQSTYNVIVTTSLDGTTVPIVYYIDGETGDFYYRALPNQQFIDNEVTIIGDYYGDWTLLPKPDPEKLK